MAEPDLLRPTRRIETFAQFQFSARWWMYFPLLVFVYAILGWGYYAYVVAFCVHHLLQELNLPTVSVILLLVFHVFFGLAVVSYVQACLTNPGEIPDGFGEAEDESAPETPLMRETKGSGQVRYCQKCQKKKPDRAHHCSTCRRCVLRMDHHCPWVNNCVGWGNYKFFMLFLGWVSVLCLYSGISAAYFAGVALTKPSHDVPLQLIGVVIVGMVFGLGLMLFAGFHVRLILNNQTTIESTEKMQRLAGHKNIYNLGSKLRNWNQVFGFNVVLWFIPVPTTPGDGLSYPTKLDDTAGTEQEPILSDPEKSK